MLPEEGERSCLVREIAQYIYDGFGIIQKYGSLDDVIAFIDRSFHRVIYIKEGNRLVGVAVYMMITDSTLDKIARREIDLKDYDTFKRVEQENGENVHIFALRAERMNIILKGLKDILRVKKPRTVSWIKPNMKDIVIIKGEM